MFNKPKPETYITPQWVTVKEELLQDFFDLAEYFSLWQTHPSDGEVIQQWVNKLKALYLKVRKKTKDKEGYKELSERMDQYLKETRGETKLNELIDLTLKLMEFIESTGITTVESESSDPVEDYVKTGFPG